MRRDHNHPLLRAAGILFLSAAIFSSALYSDAIDTLKRATQDPKEQEQSTEEESTPVAGDPKASGRTGAEPEPTPEDAPKSKSGPRSVSTPASQRQVTVFVVPIHDAISKANEYILRRSLKEAIAQKVDVVVLDMDTPGGRLDVTLEMMEMLDRFDGETITYVNKDAISAGAFISMATDAIYFSPNGVMGAAAVVSATGEEIDPAMRAKIESYTLARVRVVAEDHPYRADVLRAMADIDFELKIDGRVIKPEGELLSLSATEAVEEYGSPPHPLLAEGIAEDLDSLLAQRYGQGMATVYQFQITWSEEFAKYLDAISPILLALGLLALFIEFKTPGFGVFGITGLALVGIVFVGNHLAGLAGQEAILLFILGLALIVVDILFLPGTFILMVIGLFMVVGSLLWSMSDVWPTLPSGADGPVGIAVDMQSLQAAMLELLFGLVLAIALIVLLWRYLPHAPFFQQIVHTGVSADPDPVSAGATSSYLASDGSELPSVGATGRVTRPLHPLGEVEIDGKRYEAVVPRGTLDRGTPIQVTGYRQFALLVDKT